MQAHQSSIKVNILLQQQADGTTVASVLEVPDCNVEAASREQAIANLRENLRKKLATAEVISLELPMNQPGDIDSIRSDDLDLNRVKTRNLIQLKSIGIFKADPQFEDFQKEIQSYRDELDGLNH
jgi:predicted RNase H-like HicB family nuclease